MSIYTAINQSLRWYPIKHSKYKVWFLPSKHSANNRSLHRNSFMFVSSDGGKMWMAWGGGWKKESSELPQTCFCQRKHNV